MCSTTMYNLKKLKPNFLLAQTAVELRPDHSNHTSTTSCNIGVRLPLPSVPSDNSLINQEQLLRFALEEHLVDETLLRLSMPLQYCVTQGLVPFLAIGIV